MFDGGVFNEEKKFVLGRTVFGDIRSSNSVLDVYKCLFIFGVEEISSKISAELEVFPHQSLSSAQDS